MNLPAKMAWRYLFARKSTNAINIITLIAAFGVAIGAAALLLLLSVFNGFEDLFLTMFNNLNPDVRIVAAEGKTFEIDEATYKGLGELEGVAAVSQTLEETAIFSYDDKQNAATIKGVDEAYPLINGIDSMINDGAYELDAGGREGVGAVVGNDLAITLGIDPLNQFERLTVFMLRPKPRGGGFMTTGRTNYIRKEFRPAGIIRSQESMENQAVIISLDKARDLLSVSDSTVSSLEISLKPDYIGKATYRRIEEFMGPDFVVKNRYQQENSILKLMQVEKWVGFAIVSLMMILISFNLVGALWMIVLEKRRDISILRSLGMTAKDVSGVFLRVGLLLCGLGLLTGFILASVLFVLQKTFGLISLPGLLTEAYPISFRWYDFPVVALTVLGIGLVASLLPAQRAGKVEAVANEE
ncbi:ABC transporter permease [Neolewinella aurantiaca]|uniref:ABC transporter permease n=1 Tax=Neolewinella aurantiaca TaxID=2602767 RepID=A0A5C7FH90_9BACT|nr:FtsX-like permease family protein [Neolewinella aurantiaca]TXF85654.1 ABC transporter permease [Neolewinella aurantiaca]